VKTVIETGAQKSRGKGTVLGAVKRLIKAVSLEKGRGMDDSPPQALARDRQIIGSSTTNRKEGGAGDLLRV